MKKFAPFEPEKISYRIRYSFPVFRVEIFESNSPEDFELKTLLIKALKTWNKKFHLNGSSSFTRFVFFKTHCHNVEWPQVYSLACNLSVAVWESFVFYYRRARDFDMWTLQRPYNARGLTFDRIATSLYFEGCQFFMSQICLKLVTKALAKRKKKKNCFQAFRCGFYLREVWTGLRYTNQLHQVRLSGATVKICRFSLFFIFIFYLLTITRSGLSVGDLLPMRICLSSKICVSRSCTGCGSIAFYSFLTGYILIAIHVYFLCYKNESLRDLGTLRRLDDRLLHDYSKLTRVIFPKLDTDFVYDFLTRVWT